MLRLKIQSTRSVVINSVSTYFRWFVEQFYVSGHRIGVSNVKSSKPHSGPLDINIGSTVF